MPIQFQGSQPQPPAKASDHAYNEAAIDFALDHERAVEFRYAKGEGKSIIEERTLAPTSLDQTRGGAIVAIGFDPDRAEPRAYRLDRIIGTVVIV